MHYLLIRMLPLLMSSGLLLTGNAIASDAPVAQPVALSMIDARYETLSQRIDLTLPARSRQWQLLRSTQQIEMWDVGADERQSWQRNPGGEIDYRHIFLQQKSSVDYTEGDLRSVGRYPQWRQLSAVINPALLQQLSARGPVQVLGRTATRYTGEVAGVEMEVWWLAELSLPALVRRVDARQEVSIRLLALQVGDAVQHEFTDTTHYAHLDFADLGDMEADPLVQKLHLAEGHHGDAHY